MLPRCPSSRSGPCPPTTSSRAWRIARQAGVIETTTALPSLRLEQRRRRFEELGDDHHILVAVRHGEVVGVADLEVGTGRRRHAGEIGVGVATAHQGKGVGTALLEALLELADEWLGLRRVQLHVLAGNPRARGLYERHGFELEGELRAYLISQGRLADAWLMARIRPALERAAEPEPAEEAEPEHPSVQDEPAGAP